GAPEPSAKEPTAAPRAPGAPSAPSNSGRLLVRSTPSGASVSVDGVEKGVTPLALRELANGAINVTVTRRGYIPETRKVVITSARPARSLDLRLAAEAVAPPRPSTPATIGRPAAAATSTGSLIIDSRPTGAEVTINGKPRGNTPLTVNDLPPGDYSILMAMPGYRNFTTTVRVVAGERVRAAASLTALEQQ
ncbi:MAG: PEGA domain-containing protein, partial [Vicinamibacterales bacterium]